MTQDELDQIQETGTWGAEDRVIDGKVVRIPVLHDAGVLWTEANETCMVTDKDGVLWRVGVASDGVRYKRRSSFSYG
jgi:hypothetical protein